MYAMLLGLLLLDVFTKLSGVHEIPYGLGLPLVPLFGVLCRTASNWNATVHGGFLTVGYLYRHHYLGVVRETECCCSASLHEGRILNGQ